MERGQREGKQGYEMNIYKYGWKHESSQTSDEREG